MNLDKPDKKWDLTEFFANVGCFLIGLFICWIVSLFLGSCKAKEHVVYKTEVLHEYHTDTLRQTVNTRDSIYLHDSIYHTVYAKNDTVHSVMEKWHTQYRDRWHHDSVLVHKTDTIEKPVEVATIKEVEKKLTTIQQWALNIGYVALAAIIMAIIGGLIYWLAKINPWGIFKR